MGLVFIDLAFLHAIRLRELESIVGFLPPRGRVLEFGAGPGHQAARLAALGFDVRAVDIEGSSYAHERVFEVRTYDGRNLPFPDSYFDAVFSSNVLEHTLDLSSSLQELERVLKPGGLMIHILPSAMWRMWSTIAEWIAAPRNALRTLAAPRSSLRWGRALPRLPAALIEAGGRLAMPILFRRHGARGFAITELYTFSRRAWQRRFRIEGFHIAASVPLGLWYTGELLLGARFGIAKRRKAAKWLGSSSVAWALKRLGATGDVPQRTIAPVRGTRYSGDAG